MLVNASRHTRGSSLLSQSCSLTSNVGSSGRDDVRIPARESQAVDILRISASSWKWERWMQGNPL